MELNRIHDRAMVGQDMAPFARGQIAPLDFLATSEFIATLRALGWATLKRSGLSLWMFPPVRVVRGKKPA
jgi:hypothetical protein